MVEKEEEEEERGIGGERVARDEEGNSRWIATEERGERRGMNRRRLCTSGGRTRVSEMDVYIHTHIQRRERV